MKKRIQTFKIIDFRCNQSNGLTKKIRLKVKLVCIIFEVITGILHHVFLKKVMVLVYMTPFA